MFDLNIEMEANKTLSSVNNDKVMELKNELLEGSGTNTELSGTSSTSSEFNFFDTGEFVTRQFFPLSNERETEQLDLIRVGSSQPTNTALYNHHQWLNLSVSGSGLGSGHKQQVRKSRRGPRSRSSQYRGVTFYRRTGRWESHIW